MMGENKYTGIQLTREFKDKIKPICDDNRITYEDLFKYALECYAIFVEHGLVNENGEPKAVILSDDDLHDVEEIARRVNLTKSEVISHLIYTLKFIFDEKLTLADIIARLMHERGISCKKLQALSP